jgi:hypothetical protein
LGGGVVFFIDLIIVKLYICSALLPVSGVSSLSSSGEDGGLAPAGGGLPWFLLWVVDFGLAEPDLRFLLAVQLVVDEPDCGRLVHVADDPRLLHVIQEDLLGARLDAVGLRRLKQFALYLDEVREGLLVGDVGTHVGVVLLSVVLQDPVDLGLGDMRVGLLEGVRQSDVLFDLLEPPDDLVLGGPRGWGVRAWCLWGVCLARLGSGRVPSERGSRERGSSEKGRVPRARRVPGGSLRGDGPERERVPREGGSRGGEGPDRDRVPIGGGSRESEGPGRERVPRE